MSGFAGFVDFKNDVSNMKNILINMNSTLSKNYPDEDGFYIDKNIALSHKRLSNKNSKTEKQPIIEKYSFGNYVIVFNGNIYNSKELKNILLKNDFSFTEDSDTELLLKAYIHFGNDVVNQLNGIFAFAIWNSAKKELFLARDHFRITPLFYTIKNSIFLYY